MTRADDNILSLSWGTVTALDTEAIAAACEQAAEVSKKGIGICGKVKRSESGHVTTDFRELGGWSTLLTLVVSSDAGGDSASGRQVSLLPDGYTRKQVVAAGVIPVARRRARAFASGQRFSEALEKALEAPR